METTKNTTELKPNNSAIIQTKDLAIGYPGAKTILEKVNLSISTGSITSIVGQNGCGKSTLLKSLARQLKSHSGSIEISGKEIWEQSALDFSKQCSYLPQFLPHNINLTARELVSLGRNPHQNWWSWSASLEDTEAINTAMERANVTALAHRYISTLSGGEKQRVLIAQALAQQAKVILLDEPISSLDFKHQLAVIKLLKELKEENIAVLVVLHELNIIDHVSDHVVLVSENENGANTIKYQGAPDKVLTKERIKEVFEVDVHLVKDKIGSQSRMFSLFS